MRAVAIVGTSALGAAPLVERLVEALTLDGLAVSCVKRAPDGFDLDKPGKASFARREAGAREVILAGDRRFVLMSEYGPARGPSLEALLARLEPVDVVVVEGFHDVALPTIEVHRSSPGRSPRFASDPRIVAVVSDEPLRTSLPRFRTTEAQELAGFVEKLLHLGRGRDARREAGPTLLR